MALFCKENHCGSCEKAFCCFSCRFKHENNFHTKKQSDIVRKVLAPILYVPFQRNNSLPKILESKELNNFLKNDRKKNSIFIYNDTFHSQKDNQLKFDDNDEESNKKVKDVFTKTVEKISTTNIWTNEKITLRKTRTNFPDKAFNVTVDVDDNSAYFIVLSEGQRGKISEIPGDIENIPPNRIEDLLNFKATTAGNTPPRTISQVVEKLQTTNSLVKGPSTSEENSSVYCPCSENWTKSDNPKWISALSETCDSSANVMEEKLENSSLYFACSEFLTRELSAKPGSKCDENFEGFETFKKNPELASTKLEMTISFAQEACEFNSDPKNSIDSAGMEYLAKSLEKDQDDIEMNSKSSIIRTDNSSECTVSAHESGSISLILDDYSSIKHEETDKFSEPRREFMSAWVKACGTQTSLESSLNSLKDILVSKEEEKEKSGGVQHSVSEHAKEINGNASPALEPTFSVTEDSTFWHSFSNSLQRAYNSTKEMCNGLGRRNKCKRGPDDTEEPEPKRPKISILCRPPIRVNPRIIFRQDGNVRKPVVAYDKGTQTD